MTCTFAQWFPTIVCVCMYLCAVVSMFVCEDIVIKFMVVFSGAWRFKNSEIVMIVVRVVQKGQTLQLDLTHIFSTPYYMVWIIGIITFFALFWKQCVSFLLCISNYTVRNVSFILIIWRNISITNFFFIYLYWCFSSQTSCNKNVVFFFRSLCWKGKGAHRLYST